MKTEPTKLSPEFTRARRALLLDAPFFGQLMLNLHVLEDSEANPIWTNGKELGYSAEKFAELSHPIATGTLAKMCLHCAFEHHLRRANRDKDMWQQACDLVVNPIVLESGMQLLPGAIVDAQYEGMTTEEVYEKLRQNREQQGQQQQQQPQPGNSPGSSSGNSGASSTPGQQQTQPAPANSPAGGSGNAAPQQNTGPGGGEVRDMPGQEGGAASAAEKQQSSNDWAVSAQQAMNNSESQGMLPAYLKRKMLEALESEIDWKEHTRQWFTQQSRDDLSWSRANRRFIGRGLYLPSAYSVKMGTVVLVVDTSGSVGQVQLAAFGGHVNSIIEDLRPERTVVVYADADVAHVDEYGPDDLPIVLEAHGGGGTDFRPAMQWVEDNDINPACLVYITDMWGTYPKEEPSFPVLWAATTNRIGPFGDTVKVKEV